MSNVNYEKRRELLFTLVDDAEDRKETTCLLCKHLKLREEGTAIRCALHPKYGIKLVRLTSTYRHNLERRAQGCPDYESLI